MEINIKDIQWLHKLIISSKERNLVRRTGCVNEYGREKIMPESLKKLPIGISSLRTIVESNMAYVDKTAFVHELVQVPGRYFLSRPRRFGKSLFLDTLKELFEGSEELFRGLYIHDRWDWSKRYPVIKLDFAAGVLRNREELDRAIYEMLEANQQRLGVRCKAESIPGCFGDLIHYAREKYGQRVVILVDEYDKPILDNIERLDSAADMREGLKNLYSVMKSQDANIQFIFMTGVTKFSKVSLFSGINQLNDITLDSRFATICGYTQHDVETVFSGHLAGVDMKELREWYNGYSFLGEPVYNPFDILLFIDKGCLFRNYWFETGSPGFLIKLFQEHRYFLPDLEALEVSEEILDSFDVERIDPVTLLFQTGYLTIDSVQQRMGELGFRLKIPNQEVRVALNNQFIDAYTDITSHRLRYKTGLYDSLCAGDLEGMVSLIKRLFASIPWRNFTKNDLPEAEGYYASVLYAFFASLNAEIIPEDITNHGQVDMTVKLCGYTYVMEIKLERGDWMPGDGEANPALEQIRSRGYSEKYRHEPGKGVFEVGLVFSSKERNLVQADWVWIN